MARNMGHKLLSVGLWLTSHNHKNYDTPAIITGIMAHQPKSSWLWLISHNPHDYGSSAIMTKIMVHQPWSADFFLTDMISQSMTHLKNVCKWKKWTNLGTWNKIWKILVVYYSSYLHTGCYFICGSFGFPQESLKVLCITGCFCLVNLQKQILLMQNKGLGIPALGISISILFKKF